MHQNTFLTTPDVQNDLFWKKVFGGLEVCDNASKHVFNHYGRSKISFLKKVSGGLGVCANASKQVFNHSRRSKIYFFRTFFWWSGNMRKCIKTRLLTSTDFQNYLIWKKVFGGLEVCLNASKHVFNHSRRSKIIFRNLILVVRKCIKTRC